MSEEQLLPCPFCGRGALCDVRDFNDETADCGAAYVYCPECQIEQPYRRNKAEAIAAWNQRTPTKEPNLV